MNEDFLKELYNSYGISKKNISFDEFSKDMAKPDFQKLFYDSKKFSDKGISFDDFKLDISNKEKPISFSVEGTREAMANVDEAIKNVKVPTKPVSETVKEQKGTDVTGIRTDINWEQGTTKNVIDPEKARIEAAKVAAEKSKSTGEIIPGWKRTVDFTTGEVTDVVDEERRSAYLKTQEEIKKAQEATQQQFQPGSYTYFPTISEPDLPVYNLQKALKPYEDAVAEANGGIFQDAKSAFYKVLDITKLSSPYGGNIYNQYQIELAADRKEKLQKAEELRGKIMSELPEEVTNPLDFDSIYQYEASTSTTKEEAVNKTNVKLKDHSNRLRLVEDYNYKKLTPQQQQVADLLKKGEDVDVSSLEGSPEFDKWMRSADNVSKQKELVKNNIDKYTGVQQYIGNILGELKNKNYDDDVIESSLVNSLETLRQQKPEWSDEINDAQNFIREKTVTEGDALSAAASWGFNTANKIGDTFGAMLKGVKSTFYTESTRNLTRGDVDQVVRDEFGKDLRDMLVGASSKYNAPISSNVVEKGNLKLIIEDGKVVDIRRKDDSKIFFPTKYELQVAESYNPKVDGEGEVDYNWKSIGNTTGQVITDMIPMIAASMASGGATLPTMLGAMSTTYGSYYNEALQRTGDMKQATLYAAITSPLIGYVESKVGNLEGKLGRALTGAEKGAIERLALEVGEEVSSKGIKNYVEGRGVLTYLKEKVARSPELIGDIKGELLEEFSNFGTEAVTAAATGVEGEPLTMAEVEETAIITTLVSGLMGGARIMADNAKEINEMLGYAALNQDKFEEAGVKWVEAGRTEEEKAKRRKDFEAKRVSVTEVKDTLNYVNENNFSEKDKDELFNLSLEKAKLLYKMASSESEKTKTNLAKSIAEIDKKMTEYTPGEGAPEAPPTPEAAIEESKKGFVTEEEFNTLKQNGRIPSDVTFDQFKELPLNKQQEYRQPKPTVTEAQQTELDKINKRATSIQQRLDEDKALEDEGEEPILSKEERQRLETQLQTLNQQRDAIQKQSTAEISVQPEPQTGEGVGGQVQPEPQVTPGEGQVETEGQVEEQAQGKIVDKNFDESPDTKSFVGSYVDYQGVRGVLLEDGQGNIIVDTGEGDVLVEGALSDMTNNELGLSRAERPEINEQDIQKIEQDVTANIDPTVIQTDFGTGRVFYGGKEFKYESTNLDKDGNAVSISMTDADGNKKTIRNKQAVEEIELQKMIFEDLLNNNKITLDNEFAKQFQAQATDLGIKPTITAPQRGQRRVEPVQQGRPTESVKGDETKPEFVKRTPGVIKGFEVKKKDGTTLPPSNYTKDSKTGKWRRINETGKPTAVNTQQMIQQLEAEEKRLTKEEQKAIAEAKKRIPVEIKGFEVKKANGTTVPASDYVKDPNTGKWKRINEQGKPIAVSSQPMIKQLEAEEKRLAQEEQMAAEQKAKPKAEPTPATQPAKAAPVITVKAPAIEVTPQPEAKGEGVEKTAQKAETKPETATTKPTPEAKTPEPAAATETPTPEAPPKPQGKVGANGVPQIFFSMPGVKAVGFDIFGKFYNVVSNSFRPKIMVDINGTIIPFYMTTGFGGKSTPPGWYPIWGFGEDGWFNKTVDSEIMDFYSKYIGRENADLLKSIADELNNFYGVDPFFISIDYDRDSNLPKVEAEEKFEKEVNKLVNSKLPIKPILQKSGDIKTLSKNIKTLGDNLSKSVEGIKKQQQEEKARQEAQRKAEEQKRVEEQRKAEEQKKAEAERQKAAEEKAKKEAEKPAPKKEEPAKKAVEEEVDLEEPATEEEIAAFEEEMKMLESELAEALAKGFQDGFSVSNKSQIAAAESVTTTKENKDTVLASKRLIRVLKSVFPNMDIFLHTDEESYNRKMEELGGRPDSGGNFFYAKSPDGKVTRGRIDINLNSASPVTVAHEVSHAILLKTFGDNPVLFKKFRDNIGKILLNEANQKLIVRDRYGRSVSWASALDSFEAMYKGQEVAPEEYLVQLTAFLSESGNALTIARKAPSILEKIVRTINSLISTATNGKFSPFKNFKASEQEQLENLVDFFNSIGKTLSTGGEITADQIAEAATLNDLLYPKGDYIGNKSSVFVPNSGGPGIVENVDADALAIMNSYEFLNKALDLDKKNTVDIDIDVDELNSRLDTPLKKVKWSDFKGMPFIFTISDQLTTGDVTNPITNKVIDNLKGGLGFNGTNGNTNSAWANMGDVEATNTIDKATTIYENNKELFQKLWKDGSLPNGHIPMAVVKMGEASITSNEAVFRVGLENIKTLPLENRQKAVKVLKESLNEKINTLKEDIARGVSKDKKPKVYSDNTIDGKKKKISAYNEILKKINQNKYTDIADIIKNISKFSLPQRVLIGGEVFFGSSPTKPGAKPVKPNKPDTPVTLALLGDNNPALLHIGPITDLITEKAIKDVPSNHVIAVVGVDVLNPEITTTTHPNYEKGVKGVSIGVLDKPIHMLDAFGEAYGNAMALAAKKEAEKSETDTKALISQAVPVQAGLPNAVLKGAVATNKVDAIDKLNGFLRQAFPTTSFFTTQEAWDAVMENGSIDKKSVDGNVLYGFTANGNVYINPDIKTAKAPLHEVGHLWVNFVKDTNPALYEKGLALTEGTAELATEMEKYGDTNLAREEALVKLMSTKGETIVNTAQKAEFKEWLLSMWKYVKDNFKSLLDIPADQVEDITLDQFLKGMLADVLGGKELVPPKKAKKTKGTKEITVNKSSREDVKKAIEDIALVDKDIVANAASKVFKDPGYHRGILGKKSDFTDRSYHGEMPYTGYYFVSDPKEVVLGQSRWGDPRAFRIVDFSKYNLVKFTGAEEYFSLKIALKSLAVDLLRGEIKIEEALKNFLEKPYTSLPNSVVRAIRDYDGNKLQKQDLSREKFQLEERLNTVRSNKEFDEISNRINEINSEISKIGKKPFSEALGGVLDEYEKQRSAPQKSEEDPPGRAERLETLILKELGFEGIDARRVKAENGLKSPDDFSHGSTIFDLKPGTATSLHDAYVDAKENNTNPELVQAMDDMLDQEREIIVNKSSKIPGPARIDRELPTPNKERITNATENLQKKFRRDGVRLTEKEGMEIVKELSSWKDWYEGIAAKVQEAFGEYSADYMMFMFGSAVAANSASTIGTSLNNLQRLYEGQDIKGLPIMKRNIYEILSNLPVTSDKIRNFIAAGLGDKNAIPVDMHVWSFINSFPTLKTPSKKNFEKAKEFVRSIADGLKWDPREVQAAMWAANMLRLGLEPDTYEEYIQRKVERGLKDQIQKWREKGYKPIFEVREVGGKLETSFIDEVKIDALQKLEETNRKISNKKEEITVSKSSKTQKTKFDPRDRGQMLEDEFLKTKETLIKMISASYRNSISKGKKFTEEDFKKILDKFNISIDDSGIELLFKRAVRYNSYPRTIQRIILTPSIPDNVKDALLDNAKPKEVITDEHVEILADAIVAPGREAETNEEAVEIFDNLQKDLIDSLARELTNIRDGAQSQITYEIRALKKIAQSLIEMGDVKRSADVLAKITSLGSLFGKELREIGLNSMDAVYIVHLSRESDENREEVLNAPAKGYEKTTNRERIDSQNKAAEEALKEGVSERKKETAKKVQEKYDKRTSTEKVKEATEERETAHAAEKKKGLFDKIVGSVKDFFGVSKSSLNKKNPLADTAGKTIPAAQLAQVAKDYFMYAFYNNNGNTQKAREEFLSKKELKGAHGDIDQIIGSLVSDGTLDTATRELAQAKILEALQEVQTPSNVRKLSPAQLIAMRVKAIDKRNEKAKPKRKTLEQKIAENDVDIETLTELRNAINAELMQLPANKKEEVLARVDDILVNLRAEKLKNRATPWITKAKIREDFKRGLSSLGETVEDLMDDLSKIDVYTNSIAQEFIQRTGMTAEEAAPFVKIIEDEIKNIVDTKVKAALEKEYLDSLQGNRDDLVNAAEEYAQKASDFEAEADKLRNKTKTPEEVERLKTAQREAARYKKLAARAKSRLKTFDEKAAKRLKSGDFYQILKTITQGGLTQETVVNALANSLRVEVISKEQLNHIEILSEKIRNATMAKNSVDEEKAITELKKYLYGISNVSFLDIFKRMWESFMYGNMLSSPRTAEVAFFSGTIGLIRDVIANFFQALAVDILNFSPITIGKDGIKTRRVKPDFRNLRTLGNALLDIVGSNNIFSFSTFFEVLKGAEGISIQQMDVSGKTKDRLSNSLAEIDKADVAIDRIKQDPNWKIKPNKIAAVGALEAFKLQQRIARLLVAMDYAARSAAIPYAIRMTTAQIATESLPISATYKDIYNKTNEIINRGEAKAIAEAKAAEMAALGKNFDEKRYEKKVATSEAVLPAEVQRRVKEYADRLAWTGRIFGYSGWMANKLNGAFEKFNGEPILPNDSLPTTLRKLAIQIPLTAVKMVAIPFPGVLFRGMQSVKNATILGLFQRKVVKGLDGKYTQGKGWPLQFFKEHRLYNSAGNVDEVIKASNWEVASRIAWSTVPSVMAWALFQAMFTFDFEDDEEEKEYNEMGYFNPLKFGAFFENGATIKLKSDSDWLITGEYDSDMEAVFRGKGLQYFPNAIYYKGKKLPIVGGYKDMPWGIFFSGLAAVQERELYAEKVKGSSDATRDPLTTSDVFKIMALSGVGFLSEFGLTGALEQLSFITGIFSGEVDDKVFQKAQKNLVRTNIPAVGFATWSANLKGMYKDDDKRKGIGVLSGAMANAYVFDDFIDTYDFDALGKRIPYQESPYPILGSVERAVASINNSNYSLLTNSTFKDRQTKADIIRSKYSDFATLIRKQSPKDVLKSERTIVETFDDQSNYDMALAAATSKGEMLDTYYEYLDGLERGDFSKRLREINNIGNDHAFCSKVLTVLENNADKIMNETGLSIQDIVSKIGIRPKSKIGLTNVQDKNSKGEFKYDANGNPVMVPGYFKRSKLVELLYEYDIKVTSDGQLKFNQKYQDTYDREEFEDYMNSQAGDVESE